MIAATAERRQSKGPLQPKLAPLKLVQWCRARAVQQLALQVTQPCPVAEGLALPARARHQCTVCIDADVAADADTGAGADTDAALMLVLPR